jgi:hypothetical protein
MSNFKKLREIRVGQVWRDCDKRMNGRHIKIVRFDEGANSPLPYGHVYAVTCAADGTMPSSRETRILVTRMYPHSTGFELVRPSTEEPTA